MQRHGLHLQPMETLLLGNILLCECTCSAACSTYCEGSSGNRFRAMALISNGTSRYYTLHCSLGCVLCLTEPCKSARIHCLNTLHKPSTFCMRDTTMTSQERMQLKKKITSCTCNSALSETPVCCKSLLCSVTNS